MTMIITDYRASCEQKVKLAKQSKGGNNDKSVGHNYYNFAKFTKRLFLFFVRVALDGQVFK